MIPPDSRSFTDEDTDYDTASEGDTEAFLESLASLQGGDDYHRDDDSSIRDKGHDRRPFEETTSTSKRSSFDDSLPRATAFIAREAREDTSASHWSSDVEIMDWLKVRGPEYLTTRRKQTPALPVMECVKVDLFTFDDKPQDDVANARPESWLNRQRRAWEAHSANRNVTHHIRHRPWTFVFQFQNPGPPFVSITAFFQPTGARAGMNLEEILEHEKDTAFGKTLSRFLDSDDKEKDGKFKMVCALLKAPWALRTAVPRRPIILGKKLGKKGGLKYHRGDDYFEVDFELAQSPFIERVYRSLKWASDHAEEEIVFMIEAQEIDELPECVLGAVRLKNVSEKSFQKLQPLERGGDQSGNKNARGTNRRPCSSICGGGG